MGYRLGPTMLNEADILDALRACFDLTNPYKRSMNVVELGLVEQVVLTVDADAPGAEIAGVPLRQRLKLTLVPTSKSEDGNAMLIAQIENRLAGLPELSRASVRLLDSPVWTPERLSAEARETLHPAKPAFAILNNRVGHK